MKLVYHQLEKNVIEHLQKLNVAIAAASSTTNANANVQQSGSNSNLENIAPSPAVGIV
jgi:hypothetical protein